MCVIRDSNIQITQAPLHIHVMLPVCVAQADLTLTSGSVGWTACVFSYVDILIHYLFTEAQISSGPCHDKEKSENKKKRLDSGQFTVNLGWSMIGGQTRSDLGLLRWTFILGSDLRLDVCCYFKCGLFWFEIKSSVYVSMCLLVDLELSALIPQANTDCCRLVSLQIWFWWKPANDNCGFILRNAECHGHSVQLSLTWWEFTVFTPTGI